MLVSNITAIPCSDHPTVSLVSYNSATESAVKRLKAVLHEALLPIEGGNPSTRKAGLVCVSDNLDRVHPFPERAIDLFIDSFDERLSVQHRCLEYCFAVLETFAVLGFGALMIISIVSWQHKDAARFCIQYGTGIALVVFLENMLKRVYAAFQLVRGKKSLEGYLATLDLASKNIKREKSDLAILTTRELSPKVKNSVAEIHRLFTEGEEIIEFAKTSVEQRLSINKMSRKINGLTLTATLLCGFSCSLIQLQLKLPFGSILQIIALSVSGISVLIATMIVGILYWRIEPQQAGLWASLTLSSARHHNLDDQLSKLLADTESVADIVTEG